MDAGVEDDGGGPEPAGGADQAAAVRQGVGGCRYLVQEAAVDGVPLLMPAQIRGDLGVFTGSVVRVEVAEKAGSAARSASAALTNAGSGARPGPFAGFSTTA